MFEVALFNDIKTNFSVTGYTLNFGFGKVLETTKAPYIVQYSLDTNGDREMLCEADDFTSGQAFLQWNIYTTNPQNGFKIKVELMKYIASLKYLDCIDSKYMIQLNQHSSSPSGIDENTGLFVEIVARDITYNKKQGD